MDENMNNNERVTLQYSIALDELPEEVTRLIRKASDTQSRQLSRLFKKLLSNESYEFLSLETLSNIQQLRYTLSSIDITLGDVENIVEGFFSMQPAQQEQAPMEMPPTLFREVDDLEHPAELVEQLRLFKEKVALDEQKPTENPDE